MSRHTKVTIKYFTVSGLLVLLTFGMRPFLHIVNDRYFTLPFWVWEIEYPLCTLINIGLVIFWGYQTYQRIIQKAQRRMFCAVAYCMAGWLGLTLTQYTFFSSDDALISMIERYLWYLYFLPWMMIPLLFFLIALYIGKSNLDKIDRRWLLLWVPYALINLGIITNDFHQQAFGFPQGLALWSTEYTHRWLFYLAYFWIFLVSVAGVVVLFSRTRIVSVRKFSVTPLITLGIGQLLTIAAYHDLYHLHIAEVCILAFGSTLELCIRTNLIPNNVLYPDLVTNPEFQLYLYDHEHQLVSKPEGGDSLPYIPTTYMLDECHRVHSATIYGGYVSWIEDETEVHHLREQLQDIQDMLKEESSLIREENELNKRKISVSVKRKLYDSISAFSTPLTKRMELELDELDLNTDPKSLAHLCIQMAYLKRRSNMILKQEETNGILPCEELYNAIYEPFSYMSYLDIYASVSGHISGNIDGNKLISLYDCFYECLSAVYQNLSAVLVNLSHHIEKNGISLKMMMSLNNDIKKEQKAELSCLLENIAFTFKQVPMDVTFEDEEATIYILLTLKKEGDLL